MPATALADNNPLNKTDPLGLRTRDAGIQVAALLSCAGEVITTPGNPSLHQSMGTEQCLPGNPGGGGGWDLPEIALPSVPVPVPPMPLFSVLSPCRASRPYLIGGLSDSQQLMLYGQCLVAEGGLPVTDATALPQALAAVRGGASADIGCRTSGRGIRVACIHWAPDGAVIAFAVNEHADANTWGHFVFCKARCEGDLLDHEMVHVGQFERYGDAFVPMYLKEGALKGAGCENRWEEPAYRENWPCPH